MSPDFSARLDRFCDLATVRTLGGRRYLDPTDPENIQQAGDYMHAELMFLSRADKDVLRDAWAACVLYPERTSTFVSLVGALREKYDAIESAAA